MSKAPTDWMPLDVGEYLADTMDLSAEYHGAYLLLIMHYWKNRGPIKNDENALRTVAKISGKKTRELLQRFFVGKDGYWHHKRIDHELNKALENSKKKSNQTQAARDARYGKTISVTDNVTDNVTGLRAGTPTPNTNTNTTDIKTPHLEPPRVGVGVLKNGIGEWDVMHHLSDKGLSVAKAAADGADIYHLAGIYNEGVRNGKRERPRKADAAFPVWVKTYRAKMKI